MDEPVPGNCIVCHVPYREFGIRRIGAQRGAEESAAQREF
jgi:hypothetical protein